MREGLSRHRSDRLRECGTRCRQLPERLRVTERNRRDNVLPAVYGKPGRLRRERRDQALRELPEPRLHLQRLRLRLVYGPQSGLLQQQDSQVCDLCLVLLLQHHRSGEHDSCKD